MLGERGEQQRTQRESQRAAGDVDRHREARDARRRGDGRARLPAGETPRRPARRRPGWRASRNVTAAAPTKLSIDTATIGPDHDEQPRPPAVGEVSEADLRHRRRQLVQHRQRSGGGEAEIELGNEQRQQRRVDVAVAVHHEVRARHQQDGGVNGRAAASRASALRRPRGAAAGAWPRRILRRAAVRRGRRAPRAPTPMDEKHAHHPEQLAAAGHRARASPSMAPHAAAPMTSDATVILTARAFAGVVEAAEPPAQQPEQSAALNSAAMAVPSARPRKPRTRTSARFRATLTATATR